MTSSSPPPVRTSRGLLAVLALVLLGAGIVGASQCRKLAAESEPREVVTVPAAPAVPQESVAARASREMGEMTFAEAMAYVRPLLGDHDQQGIGLARFLQWAAQRMRWPDVALEETTVAEAAKDIGAVRGKRLCAGGSVLQIRRDRELPGDPFVGVFNPGGLTSLGFIAYGSTGKLVDGSPARFCGVVVNDLAMSVQAVGMFDLPENRPAAAPAPSSTAKAGPRSAGDRKLLEEMMKDPSKGTISGDDIAARQKAMSAPADERKVQNPAPLSAP